MGQIVQIAGALAILAAFVLAQVRILDGGSVRDLALNLAGSLILAVEAYAAAQWGFVLLEGVWALVSALALVQRLRGRAPRVGH